MKRRFIILILISVWLGSAGFSPGAARVYSKAVKFAKAGQSHFAFMYYNKLLRNYPKSKYRDRALFATGEYYFQISSLKEAETAFRALLDEYPDSKEKLYALAYLLNLALKNKDTSSVQDLEKQIIDLQQVSFVFRESKKVAHRSPLYQNYKTIIHIDKIEFYVEGKFLAKVSY